MVKQEGIGGFNKKNNIVKVKIIVSRLLYNNWMQLVSSITTLLLIRFVFLIISFNIKYLCYTLN